MLLFITFSWTCQEEKERVWNPVVFFKQTDISSMIEWME